LLGPPEKSGVKSQNLAAKLCEIDEKIFLPANHADLRESKEGRPACEAGRNSKTQLHPFAPTSNFGGCEPPFLALFLFAFIRVIRGPNF
jgi:hypothetical protein